MKKRFSEIFGTIVSNFKMGKNSKNPCNTSSYRAGKVFGEIIFILGWPVLVFIATFFASKFIPNFWATIIAIIAIIGIVLSIVNFEGIKHNDQRFKLRNLLIVLAGGINFIMLVNDQNSALNSLNLIVYVIGAALALFAIVLLILGIEKDLNKDDYLAMVSALITILVAIASLGEIWIHFGTLYIWMPILVSLTYYFFVVIKNQKISFAVYVSSVLVLLGLISTLYQFWFSEIISGMYLWHIIIIFVALGVFTGLAFFIKWWTNKKIEKEKKEKEDKEKRKRKELEEKERNEKQVETMRQREAKANLIVADKEKLDWDDVIFLRNNYPNKLNIISEKIAKVPWVDLLKISTLKKQIVWNPNELSTAMEVIEGIVKRLYDDKILEMFVNQFNEFCFMIKEYSEFEGYSRLNEIFEENCPTLIGLVNKK